jgi:hypothetical protein
MDITTTEKRVVCHFNHPDFRRCSIMSSHLEKLALQHYTTHFVQLEGSSAPFLAVKLKIDVLPSVLVFIDGVVKDRLIGFEELGNSDNFPTGMLEVCASKEVCQPSTLDVLCLGSPPTLPLLYFLPVFYSRSGAAGTVGRDFAVVFKPRRRPGPDDHGFYQQRDAGQRRQRRR